MVDQKENPKKVCSACNKEYPDGSENCPEHPEAPAVDPMIGQVFADKYEIVGILGEGGMSMVYKARHKYMDRIVAVKLMHEHLVNDKTAVARFEHESKAASSLSHQNIVTVHDFGMTKATSQAYFVMDCLDGESLSDILEREVRLPLAEAVAIFKQTCDGLEHAHKKRVVHRDLKPSNLVLMKQDDGSKVVKIVDFGIAKLLPIDGVSRQNITVTGEIFGSPLYMSPEQCNGKSLDQRSDIYSLGCLMYETLSGVPPIMGDTFVNTVVKHINETPAPFTQTAPDAHIPQQVEAVIMKCLAKNPDDRYQSAGEVRQSLLDAALEAGVRGLRPGAVPVTTKKSNILNRTFDRIKLSGDQHAQPVAATTKKPANKTNILVAGLGTLVLVMGVGLSLFLMPDPEGGHTPALFRIIWGWQMARGQEAMTKGDFEDAKRNFLEAKKTSQQFDDKHKRLLETLNQLAQTYGRCGQYAEQERVNQEITTTNTLQVLEEVKACEDMLANLRKSSESTVTATMNQLEAEANGEKVSLCAKKLLARSLFDKAEQLLQTAIATYENLKLENNQKTADFKALLAECMILQQKLTGVHKLLEDALKIRNGAPDVDSPFSVKRRARAYLRLGQFDRDQSNFQSAEEALMQGMKLAESMKPPDSTLLTEAYNSYADLARQQKNTEKADEYAKKAEGIRKGAAVQSTNDLTKEAAED